jgi:hypothetical protein
VQELEVGKKFETSMFRCIDVSTLKTCFSHDVGDQYFRQNYRCLPYKVLYIYLKI